MVCGAAGRSMGDLFEGVANLADTVVSSPRKDRLRRVHGQGDK